MRFSRSFAITLRQFYLIRGSFSRVLPLFAWVGIDMVLWGFMSRYLDTVANGEVNFVPALLGAVLFWDFFSRVMQGVSMAFFEDVWSRNFLNLFASPLTIQEYLLGLVITSVCTSAIGLLVMLALATTAFGLSFLSYGMFLLPFLLLLFVFGIALGIFAVALVLRLGPAAEWFVWPITALLAPFAGVYYPLTTLPAWMRVVSYLLPPSYVFEGVRAIAAGKGFDGRGLAVGGALALVYLGAAAFTFAHTYAHTVRTGLIARYSAETVS
ncbi:MAG: ABC transporter permease [Bdellovibrionota bacterium]